MPCRADLGPSRPGFGSRTACVRTAKSGPQGAPSVHRAACGVPHPVPRQTSHAPPTAPCQQR
eukprot:6749284-Prymnesium_polylepis.1